VDRYLDDRASSQMGSLFPEFSGVEVLPLDMPDWGECWLQPRYDSIFDEVLSIGRVSQQRVEDPKECAEIVCKLVISIFLAFMWRRYLNMLKLQSRLPGDSLQMNRCDYLRDFAGGRTF